MIIDAHQHFWQIGRNACTWPTPDLTAIHRDFGPADLAAAAAGLDLAGSVLVQSQASDTDTDYLLDLAAKTPGVLGVVGWTDLAAPDAPARIADLARHPKLKGLRPMLQGLPEDDWITRPALAPAIEAMLTHHLRLDALVFTRHLPHLRLFAEAHPDLPIVIDHGAKPPLADGDLDEWTREISALAPLGNVWCKLSGLPTEAGPDGSPDAMDRAIDTLLALFGEKRLMWGSDWPVVNLASDYGAWLSRARARTGPSAALYGDTAAAFYNISLPPGFASAAEPE